MRAGTMSDRDAAVESAEDAEANPDEAIYGLSVECYDSQEEALHTTRRPNAQVRFTTAARIRAADMDLFPTMDPPHATLEVPKPLDEVVWDRLQAVFDPPIKNPYARRRSS
jgi:hypothetical protein